MAFVPVELSRIIISEEQESQVIVLKEKGGKRILPVWIGLFEAVAINRRVNGEPVSRPMTHDLMADLMGRLHGTLEQVSIDRYIPGKQGGVFHAKLRVRQGEAVHEVDCRPSDAIALSVRLDAPLAVEERILAEEGQVIEEPAAGGSGPAPEGPKPRSS